jgi:hypothetical protein
MNYFIRMYEKLVTLNHTRKTQIFSIIYKMAGGKVFFFFFKPLVKWFLNWIFYKSNKSFVWLVKEIHMASDKFIAY